MYNTRTILGIIPARGGSKGLPKKNITKIAGKPLIAWTIESTLASAYLDKVIVSTDDIEIAQVSREYGAEVPFMRPTELAEDTTPTIDVIKHAIEFYKEKNIVFDYIALFEPTSPLRQLEDIDNAIRQLIEREPDADSLISAGEVHLEHPSIMKLVVDNYLVPFHAPKKQISRRQDLETVYFPYGVAYISKTDTLLETGTFYQERTIPYLIERWQNYEVDDIYDLICIDAVMKSRLKGRD